MIAKNAVARCSKHNKKTIDNIKYDAENM